MNTRKMSGKGRGKKKVTAATRKRTPKPWSPRVRGMVALTKASMQDGAEGRICQVLRVNNDKTKIAVRYNYNGQDVVVPYHSVVKPPADWKKLDPVNISYKKEFTNPLQPHIIRELNEVY